MGNGRLEVLGGLLEEPCGSACWWLSKKSEKSESLSPDTHQQTEPRNKGTTHIKMCRQRDKQTFLLPFLYFLFATHNEKRKWKCLLVSAFRPWLGNVQSTMGTIESLI